METVLNIFGHLHPLLVHLPIGVLLFAILIHGLSLREKYAFLSNALPIAYLIGTGTAILACLTGLILSNSGEYDETILFNHKWLGIAVAQVSLIGLFFTKKRFAPYLKIISLVLLILIFITGHYGGTLTHGEGYITKTKPAVVATKKIKAALTNTQELILYTAIIQPILEEKCYGCHSQIKQKKQRNAKYMRTTAFCVLFLLTHIHSSYLLRIVAQVQVSLTELHNSWWW